MDNNQIASQWAWLTVKPVKLTPKVKIGCCYEQRHFEHRGSDGSYSAKMPEMSGDALLIQAALLRE